MRARAALGEQPLVAVLQRPLPAKPRAEDSGTFATQALDLLRKLCSETNAALLLVSHDHTIVESFDHHLDWRKLNAAFDRVTGKS